MAKHGCNPSQDLLLSETPFRFLDLEPEICHRILEYTDLVTPLRYVRYCDGTMEAVDGDGLFHHEQYGPPNKDGDSYLSKGSPSWQWKPPTSMFLVNRAFLAMAQRVFFSQNHLEICDCDPSEIMDSWAEPGPLTIPPDVSNAAIYLSQPVRSNFLSSIRSLDIVWPIVWEGTIASSHGFSQWREAIENFKDDLKPRRLSMIQMKGDDSIALDGILLDQIRGAGDGGMLFPRTLLRGSDGIDTVRPFVDMFWPLERCAQPDGVQMFLWSMDFGVDTEKVVYYCRHRSENLPQWVQEIERFGVQAAFIHAERPFERPINSSNTDIRAIADSNMEKESEWVEGIFMREGVECEDYHEHWQDMRRKGLSVTLETQ